MKRNVIEMGGKTYVISLPAIWVKRFGIKKGEELDVEEENNRIIISTNKQRTAKTAKIDVTNLNSTILNRLLYAAYIKGVDEIYVSFYKEEERLLTKRTVNTLMGFSIVDEGKGYIRMKDMYGPATEFEPILRRVFFMLNTMIKEGIDCLKNKRKGFLPELKRQDWFIGDSVNFCLRYLYKKGYSDYTKTMTLYATIRSLENLGDEFYWLIKLLSSPKIKKGKAIFETLYLVANMFQQYSMLFYEPDKDKLIALANCKEKLDAKIIAISKTVPKGAAFIGPLWAVATRTFDLIEPKLEELY